jgi:hypothetical protein
MLRIQGLTADMAGLRSCHRCKTRARIPLDAIRRPRDTPIWKLEAALICRSCGTRLVKGSRLSPATNELRSAAILHELAV